VAGRSTTQYCSRNHHLKFLPAGALVVSIDDRSAKAVAISDCVVVIRHHATSGILAAKED